jgi:hypothetical protein
VLWIVQHLRDTMVILHIDVSNGVLTIVAIARLDDGIDANQQRSFGVSRMGHLERSVLGCLLGAYKPSFLRH